MTREEIVAKLTALLGEEQAAAAADALVDAETEAAQTEEAATAETEAAQTEEAATAETEAAQTEEAAAEQAEAEAAAAEDAEAETATAEAEAEAAQSEEAEAAAEESAPPDPVEALYAENNALRDRLKGTMVRLAALSLGVAPERTDVVRRLAGVGEGELTEESAIAAVRQVLDEVPELAGTAVPVTGSVGSHPREPARPADPFLKGFFR